MSGPTESQQARVRVSARALARAGLAHAYGHCSERIDERTFLVCAARPMGLIGGGESGTVVSVDGPLPGGVLGEVRIHQQIYRLRPEIRGICRTMPSHVMTLSALGATPRPRHGFGAYFFSGIPLWDDPQLIRSDDRARAVARALGDARAVVMRGNGAVTVGRDLEQAVVLAWFLEDAARVEIEVLKTGLPGKVLTHEEARERATEAGLIIERMWAFLTADDPEADRIGRAPDRMFSSSA